MLLEISAGGIAAYCSDLVVKPDFRESVCFISVAGHQTAVKGLLANLIEGKRPDRHAGRAFPPGLPASRGLPGKGKAAAIRLAHGLAYAKSALPQSADDDQGLGILLLGPDFERIKAMLYRHLEHKTDLPLHPSWDRLAVGKVPGAGLAS